MDKRALIVECIRLGMDFYTAALSVSCSKEEIAEMEQDESLQHTIEVNQAILEKELIEKHNMVIDESAADGKGGPLQWKLERLNPKRWGGRVKVDGNGTLPAIKVTFGEVTKEDKSE